MPELPSTPYIDPALYAGPCPFRTLPAADPAGLRALMEEARVERAVVTPFAALFHDLGWEALAEWRAAFSDDEGVRFWAVLNPDYPGWETDFEEAAAAPEVAGIRLYPRYHGYGLSHPGLQALVERAAEAGVPMNLTARLLDDRLHPRMVRVDPPFDLQEVVGLLKRTGGVRWVLSMFYASELNTLYGPAAAHGEVWLDVGCVKPPEFWWEGLVEKYAPEQLLLGTGAPFYYYGGTRLSFDRAELPAEVKAKVLRENALRLFWDGRS